MEAAACPTCGSCSGMFTANSMNCLTEALGLALPGNGTIVATHINRLSLFEKAASRVVELVVPFSRGDVLAALHREGEVLSSAQGAEATLVRARLDRASVARFAQFEPAGAWPGEGRPDGCAPGGAP